MKEEEVEVIEKEETVRSLSERRRGEGKEKEERKEVRVETE